MTQVHLHGAQDVVEFLTQQHSEIKAGFSRTLESSGQSRAQAFFDLRRLLAVHETAEEEIVHPRARTEIPNGTAIVDDRLQEENRAKVALAELESLDVDSPEFVTKLATLRDAVVEHAEHEEREEFARLADALDDNQLERMGRAARLAEAIAPTRPHAGVESASANVMVGPFASMLDRARDWIVGPDTHSAR